ncbi:hypothetical protein [Cytophaga hutchinsonii]|jgi:hypothetical protein|uniref:Lipoprotein n=1 Tax=Cytophaga hutchinsonii (strain ATCC 33406 / DSM 1761 / CIP 103989 / NBRC 15051 / NCIMB 9469 / D465) TaxID=269798 RepID=A0A6N4SSC0_CYTH3|nr:hypothetical protein [Cytophaga hutchinsonii]ABG59211.1 hypothetical protein CHU_1945 [Cytophaga hutchinsonii ATCC 33406]SFX34151.1 hypothetical protein SAMN04487930_10393 [Cytophaga hutchinsonii ATCC 33406]
MKNRKTLSIILGLLVCAATTFSCKKDKQECVTCTAVCTGSGSSEMKNCGDDNDAMEKQFRDQHPGCTVNCSREKK